MTQPTSHQETFRAAWTDMDFNQHMRNAAYLGYSEQTRMLYLASNGWTMSEFLVRRLGPVVVEDRLTYRRELGLLEEFTVDIALAGATSDVRKMAVRNRFHTKDGQLCAVVDSLILWFDLAARRPAAPPPVLRDLWLALGYTEDFRKLDEQ